MAVLGGVRALVEEQRHSGRGWGQVGCVYREGWGLKNETMGVN